MLDGLPMMLEMRAAITVLRVAAVEGKGLLNVTNVPVELATPVHAVDVKAELLRLMLHCPASDAVGTVI